MADCFYTNIHLKHDASLFLFFNPHLRRCGLNRLLFPIDSFLEATLNSSGSL